MPSWPVTGKLMKIELTVAISVENLKGVSCFMHLHELSIIVKVNGKTLLDGFLQLLQVNATRPIEVNILEAVHQLRVTMP